MSKRQHDGTMILGWGNKYANRTIEEVPSYYLRWMLEDAKHVPEYILDAVQAEYDWRDRWDEHFEDDS